MLWILSSLGRNFLTFVFPADQISNGNRMSAPEMAVNFARSGEALLKSL